MWTIVWFCNNHRYLSRVRVYGAKTHAFVWVGGAMLLCGAAQPYKYSVVTASTH